MKSKIKLAVLMLVTISASSVYAAPEEKPLAAFDPTKPNFRDVPKNHWANEAVTQLLKMGLVEGNKGDLFRGNEPATRYEVAIILARLKNQESTICLISDPPYIPTKREFDSILDRLNSIENRLKTLEEKVDAKKVTATNEPPTSKDVSELKNEISTVTQQLVQQIKTQTP